MTGADLFQLVNRAGIEAVKKKQTCITQADLIESQETIIMGRASKDKVPAPPPQPPLPYHALIGLTLPRPVQKCPLSATYLRTTKTKKTHTHTNR